MVQEIMVAPSADGWMVRTATFDSEMFFCAGSKAEAAAYSLGTKIAQVGEAVKIEIFLRDGSLGGRFIFTRPVT
jgi:hypothetical protein